MSVKYKIRDQHGLNYMTCSIVGWVDLFSRQVYRDMVLESWRYCMEHKGLQIHAYTIMSNHLHLIASCRAPHRLEAAMRDWKHFTAKSILDYLKDTTKPESRREWLLYMFSYFAVGKKDKQTYQVWQHDNHPIELYSEHVVSQKLDYIHLNAVRAGLVELPENWLYSSAPFYAANSANAPFRAEPYQPLVEIVPIWQWFYEEGPGSGGRTRRIVCTRLEPRASKGITCYLVKCWGESEFAGGGFTNVSKTVDDLNKEIKKYGLGITMEDNGPAGFECKLKILKTDAFSPINCSEYEKF